MRTRLVTLSTPGRYCERATMGLALPSAGRNEGDCHACPRASVLFLVAVLVSGCPWFTPGNRAFTSADTGRGPVFDAIGAGAEGGAPDAEGGGGLPREVVEPDVIRRQDNLLYVLNQYRGLSIVDLDTDTLLAQVPATGYPRDLYFAGGMAYVLVGYASDVSIDAGVVAHDSQRLYAVDFPHHACGDPSHIDLPGISSTAAWWATFCTQSPPRTTTATTRMWYRPAARPGRHERIRGGPRHWPRPSDQFTAPERWCT